MPAKNEDLHGNAPDKSAVALLIIDMINDLDFAEGEDVRTFRADSRLLKVIGAPRISADEKWGPSGIYYYEWKNNRLRQVHFVPSPSPSQSTAP